MKMIFIRVLLIVGLLFVGSAAGAFAQSQSQMNQDASSKFEKADKVLSKTYAKLMKHLADDPESQKDLATAQKAWEAFRSDDSRFAANLEARGGSMAPLILFSRMAELTEIRNKELQQIIKDH